MSRKLDTVLLFSLLLFLITNVKSNESELDVIDVIQNFNAINLLKGLKDLNSNSNCSEDAGDYLNSLLTNPNATWAQKMLDSSANIPDGILTGSSQFLGHFDECIAVEHPENKFIGQHCMIGVEVMLPSGGSVLKTSHSVKLLQTKEEDSNATATPLSWFYALCVPSSCTAEDIQNGINGFFNTTTVSDKIAVNVEDGNCRTKEPRKLGRGEWAVIGFLIFFGVIAILSTAFDVHQRFYIRNAKPNQLLTSFSVYTNGKFLFQASQTPGQMDCLYGLRFFSMCWVVLCHAFLIAISGPMVNMNDLASLIADDNHVLIVNGFVSVDSFFFLSGLLVCFVFFRDIAKKGSYDVPLAFIHRYIRLTPPYAVMILLQITIILYLGDGPLWNTITTPSADACRKSWWSGLIYVQNYVNPESQCLGQSWYLSADMNMYWISPLILYPMLFWPKFAPILLGVLILGAAFTTFAIGYVKDLGPSLLITRNASQGKFDYVPFHTRLAPWLIGLTVGYLLCGIQAKKIKIKLTNFWNLVGWLTATGLCLGSLYGIVEFTHHLQDYNSLQAAFYLAFHRVAWGLGLAWIVFACTQGYGGLINGFLSWSIFQPLGKLSYCVFLIHSQIQIYRIATLRTNTYVGDFEVTHAFLGDMLMVNLLAIPFTLLFEMPFGNLDRYFFRDAKILPFPMRSKKDRKLKPQLNNSKDVEPGNVNEGYDEKS